MNIYETLFQMIYNDKLENISDNILNEIKSDIVKLRLLYKKSNPVFEYTSNLRNAYMLCYYINYAYIVDLILKECINHGLISVVKEEVGICCYAAGPAPELYAFASLLST